MKSTLNLLVLLLLTSLSSPGFCATNATAATIASLCPQKAKGLKNSRVPITRTEKPNPEYWKRLRESVPLNEAHSYRWVQAQAQTPPYLERKDLGRNFISPAIKITDCRVQRTMQIKNKEGGLLPDVSIVECGELVSMLYAQDQMLLISLQQKRPARISILEEAETLEGIVRLVEVLAKTETLYYLLVPVEETWGARLCARKEEPKP